MATLADKIIELINKNSGLTDREITDKIKGSSAPQQHVNQEARHLERKGILKRTPRHDGKIGNYMAHAEIPVSSSTQKIPAAIIIPVERPNRKITIFENPIVCIPCVKSKNTYACEAQNMYVSSLFCKSMAYAKSLNPKKIFILSAKYGLLNLEDVIEPYEQTLKNMSSSAKMKWAETVIEKMRQETDLNKDTFVFLTGKSYRENILPHIKHFSVPMDRLSFGRQLQWLDGQMQ